MSDIKISEDMFQTSVVIPEKTTTTQYSYKDLIRKRDFYQVKVDELNALIAKAEAVGIKPINPNEVVVP